MSFLKNLATNALEIGVDLTQIALDTKMSFSREVYHYVSTSHCYPVLRVARAYIKAIHI